MAEWGHVDFAHGRCHEGWWWWGRLSHEFTIWGSVHMPCSTRHYMRASMYKSPGNYNCHPSHNPHYTA